MKTQEAIKLLESQGYKIEEPKKKYIDFPKLNLRLYTKVCKATTFKEAEKLIPKGFRLPYLWEFFYILEDEKIRELLNPEKECIFFWIKRNSYNIKSNNLFWAYLYRSDGWYENVDYPSNSNDLGRVVFVEDLK